MKTVALALLCGAATLVAAERDPRCFELRTYYAAPGKLEALHARFRDHTVRLFTKHGMESLGYWVPLENPDHQLIFLLAHPSRQAREQSWKAFMADPDWQAAFKASEAGGRLVTKVESLLLTATDYSPAVRPSASDPPRCFELRTYTAAAGKLDALHARFRDHTVRLFTKHGMSQVGYWTPDKDQKGADKTLLYILAHPSTNAAAASFKAFRADPDWIAAKEASEKQAGGSLTEGGPAGVKSLFLKATDYSPMK